MNNEPTDEEQKTKYVWLTEDEYNNLISQMKAFSDYQRVISIVLVIGIFMILLHISTDLFFNLTD